MSRRYLEPFFRTTNSVDPIFTLPAGYRPSGVLEIPVKIGFGGPVGYLVVQPTGTVAPGVGSGDVHFDGISFPAN